MKRNSQKKERFGPDLSIVFIDVYLVHHLFAGIEGQSEFGLSPATKEIVESVNEVGTKHDIRYGAKYPYE